MSEWIIVRADDHRPHPIGSNASPFRVYAEGSNPNASGTPIDNGVTLVYLPVLRLAEPVAPEINPVTEQAQQQSTVGDNDVSYPGAFAAPNWVVGWDIIPQDISVSRMIKTAQLNAARDARVTQGYELDGGNFPVPLTEDMGVKLAYEADQFEKAVQSGDIPATTPIQFFGAGGQAIELGVESLRAHSTMFYLTRKQLNADYMAAVNAINAAETPVLVDAVAWEF